MGDFIFGPIVVIFFARLMVRLWRQIQSGQALCMSCSKCPIPSPLNHEVNWVHDYRTSQSTKSES